MLAVIERPPRRSFGEEPELYEFWPMSQLTRYVALIETIELDDGVLDPRPIYYKLVEMLGPDAGRYCRTSPPT